MINRGFLVLIQIAKKYVRKFTQKELYRPFAVNFVVVVVSRSLSVQNSSMIDDNAIFFHNIFVCFFFIVKTNIWFNTQSSSVCLHKISLSKFKFVAILQSLYGNQSASFPSNSLIDQQDTDFSSQYLSRHRFDLPSSSSSFGANAYMSTSSSQSLAGGMMNPNTAGTNLIVNYLPQDMTDRELYSLFRHSGPIESCRVMRDFKVRKRHPIVILFWEMYL